MEIFERAKVNIHPQRAPIPEEGIKRANVGASLLCKQTLYPERSILQTLSPPIAFADNTQPLPPFPLDLSSSNGGKLPLAPSPPPIARNDVIYPAYLMKPRLKTFFKTRFKSFEVETRDFPPDYSSSFLFLLLSLSVSLRRRRYQQ